MLYLYFPQMLSIMDKLNEWNEKLNELVFTKYNNLGTGVIVMAFLILIAVFAIHALNKR